MTGKLFPTGKRCETITATDRDGKRFSVSATMIDAANPFVVVEASSLPPPLRTSAKDSPVYLEQMESIRRAGAVAMGLAPNTAAAAKVRGTPKLAIVSPSQSSEDRMEQDSVSIHVQAFSMGKPHPSLQLTGAACLGSAACIEGTVAHHAASQSSGKTTWSNQTPERTPSPSLSDSGSGVSALLPDSQIVRISHPSGSIEVDVLAASSSSFAMVDRCIVSRTARRIFEGNVYYYQDSL
jgi:2-methylaconitate cis-trans-isomerase PrpF